jgi:hypothetical protein
MPGVETVLPKLTMTRHYQGWYRNTSELGRRLHRLQSALPSGGDLLKSR